MLQEEGQGQETQVRCHLAKKGDLSELLERFWKIEDIQQETPISEEEAQCEKQFHEETQ